MSLTSIQSKFYPSGMHGTISVIFGHYLFTDSQRYTNINDVLIFVLLV